MFIDRYDFSSLTIFEKQNINIIHINFVEKTFLYLFISI